MSGLKKAALIGGGAVALGAAGGGAAKLLRKKKLRIGTPLSPSKVVNYTPIKTRQATGRVVEMSARLDERLREFISTAEEPWNYSPCEPMADGGRKPNFPSLYLSRSTDKGLMKMPGEGQAVVNYKIKSRSIDENADDGVPLYGASIEIRSIEPMAAEEGSELSETLFLREFGVKPRSVTKLMKTSKLNPLAIRKTSVPGEFRVAPKGSATAGPLGYYTDDIKDARNAAAAMWKKEHAQSKAVGAAALRKKVDRMETGSGNRPDLTENAMPAWATEKVSRRFFSSLREFGVARDRDGEGRYAAGNVPGADDYAIAAMARKKKVAVGAGAGVLAAGALGMAPGGRKAASSLIGGASRMLLRR